MALNALFTLLPLLPAASAMYFVPREDWSATPPKGSYTPITSPLGVKVHYVGPSFTSRNHSECAPYMKSIQDMHLADPTQGWMDIAYNLGVCEHGYVFDGRGKGHRSGANGDTELNKEHYAVLAFLGKEGLTVPTEDQVVGVQDAIAYLRRAGAGDEVKGHKDGFSTECPGAELYELVTGGGLDPGKLFDGGEHVVKDGETVADIAKKYNVPERYISFVNGLEEGADLKAGDKLEIPARGVPLDKTPGGGGGGEGGAEYEVFPGDTFFKGKPDSPIVKNMGERLVEEGCDKYASGPATQWTDEDVASYSCWQEKIGYTGADADGWPGQSSWDQLKVPAVDSA